MHLPTLLRAVTDIPIIFIAENVVVGEDAVVGEDPQNSENKDWGITVVGDNLTVGKGAKITANKMILTNVKEGEEV